MRSGKILLTVFLLLSCSPTGKKDSTMRALPFEVTGSTEAKPFFETGLLLLHNFEYDDAAEAFREAQKLDPEFVMAYWGEAMSYNHPVWRSQNAEKGRTTLNKLGPDPETRIGKARTAIEKGFVASLDILYGKEPKEARDRAYSEAMGKMYEQYPANHEVAAFYALSLLGIEEGFVKEFNTKGAEIAEKILAENPQHPGALHYLIHSDDHPEYAKFALAAANNYAKVASYAGHALHMPSHIYLALGMWDEVVRSNEVSWKAGVDRKAKKGLNNDALNYHGHWWLEYGYLQQGRVERAMQLLQDQVRFTNELPSLRSRYHLIAMLGHYRSETNDWMAGKEISFETRGLELSIRSTGNLLNGMAAFQQKDAKGLDGVIQTLEKDVAAATHMKVEAGGVTMCGGKVYADGIPTEYDIMKSNIIVYELKGMAAWLKGDVKVAETFLLQATEQEDKIGYFFGPPDIIKPTHEFFGDFLLAIGRPQEAYTQFEKALKRAPGRLLSLKGELDAARQIKDQPKVEELEKVLEEMLKNSDEKVRKNS